MQEIRFDRQVVLVSGAGRGLGAAYAKLFAARGATVVVHDAGVAQDGQGSDPGPAMSVVDTIRHANGEAVAELHNLDTREACEALIEGVLARYGRLDVLVHSAGLVLHKGLEDTTPEMWQTLLRVNIEAPLWLCRAAWPTLKQQRYGRIVLSVSGYGLRVQEGSDVTAYGVGKAAQFGLMNGLAGEGAAHGILVNAISPVAATRIFTRSVAPGELLPEAVAPGVVFLGSSACTWTGRVLQAAGGRFALGAYDRLAQVELKDSVTPEAVAMAFG